jgi:hypothetical protein
MPIPSQSSFDHTLDELAGIGRNCRLNELVDDRRRRCADSIRQHGFVDPNATFAVEPQPAEYEEALQHAQSIYDFVVNLLPSEARP